MFWLRNKKINMGIKHCLLCINAHNLERQAPVGCNNTLVLILSESSIRRIFTHVFEFRCCAKSLE